jgi:LysR family glycine cleavage system transcriptional activator
LRRSQIRSPRDDGAGYWLAYPEGRRNVPKIKAFRDWIVAEAAKEQ